MTAALTATLPVEVQQVVAALEYGPSMLIHVKQADITAAFDHGLIETVVGGDGKTFGHTLYSLRQRSAVAS